MRLVCKDCGHSQHVRDIFYHKLSKLLSVCNQCNGIAVPDANGIAAIKKILRDKCIRQSAALLEKINELTR